ncbi:MAG TPA: hypothetical protein VGF65_06050, partial [Mycobacterium sp.]
MTEPAPWTRLFNRVKTAIPAAIDAVIRQEIFSLMIDFTAETNTWIEDVPFTTDPAVVNYPLLITEGTPNRLLLVYDSATEEPYHWADNNITMRIPGILHLMRSPTEVKNWVA